MTAALDEHSQAVVKMLESGRPDLIMTTMQIHISFAHNYYSMAFQINDTAPLSYNKV